MTNCGKPCYYRGKQLAYARGMVLRLDWDRIRRMQRQCEVGLDRRHTQPGRQLAVFVQRALGCAVESDRTMPASVSLWSTEWTTPLSRNHAMVGSVSVLGLTTL